MASSKKAKALRKIAEDIARCRLCRTGGTGKAVPGEGNPDARIVFIGEAPAGRRRRPAGPSSGGRESFCASRSGIWPGRRGRCLHHQSGPLSSCPGDAFNGNDPPWQQHLFEQLSIIKPDMIVLLGNSACVALLDGKVEITKKHGTVMKKDGWTYFITVHPAYAVRFAKGKDMLLSDFSRLKRLIAPSQAALPFSGHATLLNALIGRMLSIAPTDPCSIRRTTRHRPVN